MGKSPRDVLSLGTPLYLNHSWTHNFRVFTTIAMTRAPVSSARAAGNRSILSSVLLPMALGMAAPFWELPD